jgi:hypothetical protein
MASNAGPVRAATALQEGAVDTGNGTSLTMTGATRGFLVCEHDDPDDFSEVGAIVFEESHDDGAVWSAATGVSVLGTDDPSPVVTGVDASAFPAVFKIAQMSGPSLVRARITTAFDESISVYGFTVGR